MRTNLLLKKSLKNVSSTRIFTNQKPNFHELFSEAIRVDSCKKDFFKTLLKGFLFGLLSINLLLAQEAMGESKGITWDNDTRDKMRIIISISGPAEFASFWLANPPRLVVKFKTQNIVSKMDDEIVVNQGVIKKITSTYVGEGEGRVLTALTFELLDVMPYEIRQEGNSIILDLHTPLEMRFAPGGDKEVFSRGGPKGIVIKRLAAMEAALKPKEESQPLPAAPVQIATSPPSQPESKTQGNTPPFRLIGLPLILGWCAWIVWLWNKRRQTSIDSEMAKFKARLKAKDKLIAQEIQGGEAVEQTTLQAEQTSVEQAPVEQAPAVDEAPLQRAKESEQVELEPKKEEAPVGQEISSRTETKEEGGLCMPEKPTEKRRFSRLDLSRDYNRTIIVRVESEDKSKRIRTFANNIGMGGLSFETRTEFKEGQRLALRLFFFGDVVPMMRMKAQVVWQRKDAPVNLHGLSFISLEEKDREALGHYIESKM